MTRINLLPWREERRQELKRQFFVILFGMALFFLGDAMTAALQYVASAEAVQEIVFWTIGNCLW